MVGVQKCAFYVWDEFNKHLVIKAQYGFPSSLEPILSSEIPAVFQILHTQKPVFIQDPKEELFVNNLSLNAENGTFVVLPLTIRGEIMGAFLVVHEGSEENNLKFSNQTLSILQGISHQTSISLDNMRLVEARQEEAYITAVLLQVAQAVVSQGNLQDTFDTIVNLLPILIGVSACAIYLPAMDQENGFRVAEAFADHFDELTHFKIRNPIK